MDEQFEPPPIAMIPPPDVEPPSEAQENPEVVAMQRAAATVARYERQRQEQSELIEKATAEIRKLMRENELLRLDLVQCQNNLAVAQSQVEAFRQEASDMRALFSSIRAQFDHFEVPLPIRKRVARNGNKTNGTPRLVSSSADESHTQVEGAP